MSIEDEIRRIAREEIARLFPQHRDGLTDVRVPCKPAVTTSCACTHGGVRHTTCGAAICPLKPDYWKAYDADVEHLDSGQVVKRNGCTCPPGSQTSCPDVTCPWKPR